MSGVYIKGLEMPEPGTVLDVKVYSDGLATVWDKKVGWIHHYAIPVPDHGRLVDADAHISYCYDKWIPLNVDAVNAQPTVIPADGEADNG